MFGDSSLYSTIEFRCGFCKVACEGTNCSSSGYLIVLTGLV